MFETFILPLMYPVQWLGPLNKVLLLKIVSSKGQIISKCPFGFFNFFKKKTKTRRILVKMNSFVRFLEKFMAWQFAFEINWPLDLAGNLPDRKWTNHDNTRQYMDLDGKKVATSNLPFKAFEGFIQEQN